MFRTAASVFALGFALSAQAAFAQAAPAADPNATIRDDEARLEALQIDDARIQWVNATYITDDTDAIAAKSGGALNAFSVQLALDAAKLRDAPGLSAETRRKIDLLRVQLPLAAPTTPGAADELAALVTKMSSNYGKGKGTLAGKPISGSDIEAAMGTERDPERLKEMWTSWHDNVGAPIRADYIAAAKIANKGAAELGFADTGAMWRAGYDMPPEQFAALTDKLWKDVEPLYQSLFTYVRWKLNEKYGDAVQPKAGPLRADLLGNMWAQEWSNIYDIVAPKGAGDVGYDVGALLRAKGYDALKMVKAGENFYSSLGFAPLPDSFWARSQFVKPADREVICHASAWDIDNKDDVRIKMCIKVNAEDFVTIHHELGHNYYQRAYKAQPFLFKNGANDGFHEAIGDFIALSITPQYLVDIGLLDKDKVPSADKDIGLLLRQALEKVPGLAWTQVVDHWRWGVFSGDIKPDALQAGWDRVRLHYQGVKPPVPRDETRFDPGAKYHIPAQVPYMRYFLARLLQFQFYKAACEQAGWKGPLHRCSFYGNKGVGARLNAMLALGQSKSWPEALEAFTGSREISGKAVVEYFAPLKAWLDEQNKGKPQGW